MAKSQRLSRALRGTAPLYGLSCSAISYSVSRKRKPSES